MGRPDRQKASALFPSTSMGGLVSKAKLVLYAATQLSETYDLLKKRLDTPPGIPVDNPTLPLWTVPVAPIPSEPSDLPEDADIVVIGSGITGTSFTYNLLTRESGLRVVMLEARDACSGATGRLVTEYRTSAHPSTLSIGMVVISIRRYTTTTRSLRNNTESKPRSP